MDVECVQRCYSLDFLPILTSDPPLTSTQYIFHQIFSLFGTVRNPRYGCVSVKVPVDQQFMKYSARLAPTTNRSTFKVTSIHFPPHADARFKIQQVCIKHIELLQVDWLIEYLSTLYLINWSVSVKQRRRHTHTHTYVYVYLLCTHKMVYNRCLTVEWDRKRPLAGN